MPFFTPAAAASGGTSSTDDSAFTPGTSSANPISAYYDDTTPDAVDEGDTGVVRMSDNRSLYIELRDAAGNERGLNVDASGNITANINGTVTVDNGGTFAVQVDGSALTALQLIDNIVQAEDAAHGSGDSGVMALAVRQDSQVDFGADGDYVPLSIDANGALRVSGGGGGTEYTEDAIVPANPVGTAMVAERDDALAGLTPAEGDWSHLFVDANGALWVKPSGTVTVDGSGVTQPVSGTVTANLSATDNAVLDSIDTDLTTIIGHVDGVEGLLTTIDADTGGILTAVQLIDNAISGTEMQVDVVGALPAGTNNIGDVDVASIAAGTNSIGNVGLVPRTSGGMTIFRSIDIDETEEQIKATAGQVFSISAFNTTAAPLYLKFYNATAANVTVGTTTPVLTFVVPGNADSDGAGFAWNNDIGFTFGTAITVACTTGVADSDTGAPGANACLVNVGYA